MTNFASLGLAEPLVRAVTEAGYDTPTPIQEQAIPVMLQGGDLMGLAQTGTGKTAAFVLPLINRLIAEGKQAPGRTCQALVLAPTRELAAQIGASIASYAKHTKITHSVVFGGVKPGPQIRALARGVDILVATPGRLLDHMGEGKARLDMTRYVVLDEADQMLDLGFIPAIRKLLGAVAKQRQTVMFSATMPKQIRSLSADFLTNPKTISVTPPSKPVERIEQKVLFVEQADKPTALIDLMAPEAGKRTIIFTRTKHRADRVAKKLVEYGHKANAIHGNKSQNQRERALDAFKSGAAPVLVATDIAARGIDVDGVELVVNFELPNVSESYVHRIGRTARAGASGRAVALCAPDERALLHDIEKLIGRAIEPINEVPPMPKGAAAKPAKPQGRGRKRPHRGQGGQGGGRGQGQAQQGGGQKRRRNKPKRAAGGQG
ncbi:DEAD/DEAH box helicase [Maricaulaceae bacterium EIL42A08]|nr:DEAD/DEAH box helicase [Maricaulaceae bacterium EIL42A08]